MVLAFGLLLIFGSLAMLFKALGIFGKQQSAAAARLRELTDSEIVVAGPAKNLQQAGDARPGFRLTPQAMIDKGERNYMVAGRPEGSSVAKILP